MQNKQRGIVRLIVLVIIALVLIKYFLNWDIFDAAASDQGQSTIIYTRNLINLIWSYIASPVTFIWHNIFWPLLQVSWKNFQAFVDWGQNVGNSPCCGVSY